MWVTLGILVAVFAAFIWWRYTSVERGARQRDERILAELTSVGERIGRGESVSASEVRALAERPHLRWVLYQALRELGAGKLFPKELETRKHYGEAMLVYWMMHPNELEGPPAAIELVKTVPTSIGPRTAEFDVYRYRMPEGHWAGESWLLGLAGPFFAEDVPYSGSATAFSLADDKDGEVTPEEVVDRYLRMVERKWGRNGE